MVGREDSHNYDRSVVVVEELLTFLGYWSFLDDLLQRRRFVLMPSRWGEPCHLADACAFIRMTPKDGVSDT